MVAIVRPKTARRTGFTLIELLVVIAVIAILAAILFPVFAQARDKARQASCLSNLKQLDMAFQMYKQDYDDSYPYWSWWYSSDQGGCPREDLPEACGQFGSLWINAVYPYVKSAPVYQCPGARITLSAASSSGFGWANSADPETLVTRYGFERALVRQWMGYAGNEPFLNGVFGDPSDAIMDRPASTLLVAEGTRPLTGGYARPDRDDPNDPQHAFILRRVAYANQCAGTTFPDGPVARPEWDGADCTRHAGGANIGYGDGHAKWRRATRITWDLGMGDQADGD